MSPRARAVVDDEDSDEETWEWDEDELEDDETEWDEEREGVFGAAPFGPARRRHVTGLCLGFLAMLPLITAYELGRSALGSGARRNAAELYLFMFLDPFGDAARPVRWVLLAAAAIGALWVCWKRRVAPVPEAGRIVGEGLLGALLLGPALALATRLVGRVFPDLASSAGQAADLGQAVPPSGARAALALGAGAWEEIFFRVLLYGLVFLLARRVLTWFGAPRRVTLVVGEGFALVLSSITFAALHLQVFMPRGWTGGGGFDGRGFVGRRGPGPLLPPPFPRRGARGAAGTHGVFTLALLLRIDPDFLP